MRPIQRLVRDLPEDTCRNCSGAGFLIVPHFSDNKKVEPNEVVECGVCNGTGKHMAA